MQVGEGGGVVIVGVLVEELVVDVLLHAQDAGEDKVIRGGVG